MKKNNVKRILIGAMAIAAISLTLTSWIKSSDVNVILGQPDQATYLNGAGPSYNLPKGWFKAGSMPDGYEMGTDKGAGQNGTNAATIRSTSEGITGFGTLMQECKPDKYLGKRIRMTGYVKTEGVENWAGLWLRVDQPGSTAPLAFDNMQERSIKGTTNWTKYEIVLNVPANASKIAFGSLLTGSGQIWFSDLKFEVVDNSVMVTGRESTDCQVQSEPSNLNFTE